MINADDYSRLYYGRHSRRSKHSDKWGMTKVTQAYSLICNEFSHLTAEPIQIQQAYIHYHRHQSSWPTDQCSMADDKKSAEQNSPTLINLTSSKKHSPTPTPTPIPNIVTILNIIQNASTILEILAEPCVCLAKTLELQATEKLTGSSLRQHFLHKRRTQ